MKYRAAIVIPTYDERDNIGRLIDRLEEEFSAIPHEMNILVVDDNSPDGAAQIVRAKQQDHVYLHWDADIRAMQIQRRGALLDAGETVRLETAVADEMVIQVLLTLLTDQWANGVGPS